MVLGLGASGLAMARWCARLGASVTVVDTRSAPPQLAALQASVPASRFVCAPMGPELLAAHPGITAVFKSPGLAPVEIAGVTQAAAEQGIAVRGELSLFAQGLRDLQADQGYAPKVLAITGTNGKTTVTSLTGHLLTWAGMQVAVAGNIGPTLLDTLAQAIDADALPQAWVLELSSFQLDGVDDFEPTAAVVLNLTQDHLDWHADMAEYGAAKARIFGKDGLMVLNREDAAVMGMLPEPIRVKLQKPQYRAHVSFGCDMPQRPGDFGLEEVNGMV